MRKRALRKLPLYLLAFFLIGIGILYFLLQSNKKGFLEVAGGRVPAIAGISTKLTSYIPEGALSNIHKQGLARIGVITVSTQSSSSLAANIQEDLKNVLEAKLEEFKKFIMDTTMEKMGYVPKDKKQ